jgi:hypothetical protein
MTEEAKELAWEKARKSSVNARAGLGIAALFVVFGIIFSDSFSFVYALFFLGLGVLFQLNSQRHRKNLPNLYADERAEDSDLYKKAMKLYADERKAHSLIRDADKGESKDSSES